MVEHRLIWAETRQDSYGNIHVTFITRAFQRVTISQTHSSILHDGQLTLAEFRQRAEQLLDRSGVTEED